MRKKKLSGLVSVSGAVRLMTQAMMGSALGLAFSLTLTMINPVFAALLEHGGRSGILVFVATLVTTFAIGATLTGTVLILAEDNES